MQALRLNSRGSRFKAAILALLTAMSIWLSVGTLALSAGDATRIAVLPSIWILAILVAAGLVVAGFATAHVAQAWPLAISAVIWLPFLPWPVPDAFLIWQGPLEWLIWLLVAAGLVIARAPAVPRVLGDASRAPWVAAAVLAALALTVFSNVRSVMPGGDEPHYVAATQSLLHDGDLKVANNYAQGDYLDYFPGRLEPHYLVRALDGEIYSVHAPGVSVVILPAFALAGYAGSVVMIVLIASISAALTWRLAYRLSGADAASAWVGVAAVFFTAPYFFHTFAIYPEVIGSLCVLAGLWLLIELADGRVPSSAPLIAVGAGLAALPWLHSRFAVLAGVLGILVVARLAAHARAVANSVTFLSVPVVAGLGWFAFFYFVWGSPSPTAPYGADTSTSASYILRGLIGLLFDQQFGVLTTAPIYVAAAIGWVVLLRRNARLAVELLLIVVPYTITVASYAMWWAGSAAPARFLVSILPLAALPIAVAWKEAAKQPRRWFLLMLLVASVALIAPRAFVESGRLIINTRGAIDGTLVWLSSIVDLPLALPSVHRDGGTDAISYAAAWVSLFVAAIFVAARTLRLRRFGEAGASAAWTVSALAFASAATLAVAIVGDSHGASIVTPERSRLAVLDAYRPAIHQTIVALDASRQLTADEFLADMAITISAPAVRLNRVPAGEYAVETTSALVSGPLAMFVGRNDPPIEEPSLETMAAGGSQFRLRLPVAVQTLNVMARNDPGHGASWLSVRPLSVTAPPVGRNALRATRYGRARVFFFDDWAYLERDGFWTRADGEATVVIDTDDSSISGLPMSVTAGQVPTTIQLSIGGWSERLALEPGQKRNVVLPPPVDGTWTLRIRSGAGFRPSEREAGNRDVRKLAAWMTIP